MADPDPETRTPLLDRQRRSNQFEGAVRRLDDTLARLKRQANALRQEEITEEIEVMLLSARE